MGVADKSGAKIYRNSRKLNQSINGGSRQKWGKNLQKNAQINRAQMYLQIPLRQWGAGNVYLLVLSSWKVNIAKNPIAAMGLYIFWSYVLT